MMLLAFGDFGACGTRALVRICDALLGIGQSPLAPLNGVGGCRLERLRAIRLEGQNSKQPRPAGWIK